MKVEFIEFHSEFGYPQCVYLSNLGLYAQCVYERVICNNITRFAIILRKEHGGR
jgi:hypothetical protein